MKGLGLGLLALGLFILLLRLQRRANQMIRSWISNGENSLLSGWKVGETEIIAPWQERGVLQVLRIGVHWLVLITLAYLFIPVVLGSFPPTRGLALSIWLSLLQGLGHVWQGFVNSTSKPGHSGHHCGSDVPDAAGQQRLVQGGARW